MTLSKNLTYLFLLISLYNFSQLSVREFENKSFSFNDQDSVFNITVDCDSRAFGYFISDTDTLDIDKGLVLSTGKICSILGPNNSDDTSTNLGYPSTSSFYYLNS